MRYLVLFILPLIAAACAEEGKYPFSGEQCHAEDPVHEISPPDCAALPMGSSSL